MAGPSGTTPILTLPYPLDNDTVDVPRDVRALAEKLDPLGFVPVGALLMWPTAVPPGGWLVCDGRTVDAATYPALAAVLGSAGGLITLPALGGRVPVGADASHALGSSGGAAQRTLTAAQSGMPLHNHGNSGGTDRSLAHMHNVQDVDQGGGNLVENGGLVMVAGEVNGTSRAIAMTKTGAFAIGLRAASAAAPDHLHAIPNAAARNATDPVNIEQPYLAVNYIIRAS